MFGDIIYYCSDCGEPFINRADRDLHEEVDHDDDDD